MNITGNIVYDILIIAGVIALTAIAVEVLLTICARKKSREELAEEVPQEPSNGAVGG